MPVALTLNVAALLKVTDWLTGWVVMAGGTITASKALVLVALPATLLAVRQ